MTWRRTGGKWQNSAAKSFCKTCGKRDYLDDLKTCSPQCRSKREKRQVRRPDTDDFR